VPQVRYCAPLEKETLQRGGELLQGQKSLAQNEEREGSLLCVSKTKQGGPASSIAQRKKKTAPFVQWGEVLSIKKGGGTAQRYHDVLGEGQHQGCALPSKARNVK